MARRGTYRKGREKREEILRVALETFAEQGYRNSSIRQIAQRVGLSQQGLMHHFESKEQLLAEVLALRDTLDGAGLENDLVQGLRDLVHRNAARPGLVRLFCVLSAEATDPQHPAHGYFADRYDEVLTIFRERLESDAHIKTTGLEPEILARLFIALLDGLQIQWLLHDDLTMEPAYEAFVDLVFQRPPPPKPRRQPRKATRT